MTEREKMLSGELYCAEVPDLAAGRHRADLLCRQLNALPMSETALRMQVLRELLGKVGENCVINPQFRCDYGCYIQVGENFYANYNCVILDCAPVTSAPVQSSGPGAWSAGISRKMWWQWATPAVPSGPSTRRNGNCFDKEAHCVFLYHIAERKEAMGRPITKRQRLPLGRTTRRREYRKDAKRPVNSADALPCLPGAYSAYKYAGNRKTEWLRPDYEVQMAASLSSRSKL